MNVYVGIDPGKTAGALAALNDNAEVLLIQEVSKVTLKGKTDALASLQNIGRVVAVLEKVWAGPSMGASAAFKFGQEYGQWEAALTALKIPYELSTAQNWQKTFGLIVKGRGLGQGDTEKKRRNRQKAESLFPEVKMTNAKADALLIAEHCRRVNG